MEVARRFGPVVLEDLKIANMTASVRGRVGKPGRAAHQKARLTWRILAQGRNSFANKLSYKMEERGSRVVTSVLPTPRRLAGRGVSLMPGAAKTKRSSAVLPADTATMATPMRCKERLAALKRCASARGEIRRQLVEAATTQARHAPLGNRHRSRRGRC